MTLDRVVTIQRPTSGISPIGQEVLGYEDVGEFHAALNPKNSMEMLADFMEISKGVSTWVVRYGIEVKGGYRVKHGTDLYLVRGVIETKTKGTTGRGRYLTLHSDLMDGGTSYTS